ncbi:MAG: hypothetical protein CMM15_07535 [Rhodospirillaceae bacterium]|nr:hypothetical protein [Rhodospirillaceae bacterium]
MNVASFFPSYTPIDSNSFYQDLYEMKEFHDLGSPGKMDGFYHHQIFPARFLSPWTSLYYNSLLLIHDTGTGKSASIAALLNITKTYNPKVRMLYLTRNDVLIANFKRELLKLCPYLNQVIAKNEGRYEDNKDLVFRHEMIDFSTFATFANRLKDSPVQLQKKYNNALIIFDEVHHLVNENLLTYMRIQEFLEKIPRKRLLLSTATPMRDSLLEAILLLNLMIPPDERLPVGEGFIKKYLRSHERRELKEYSHERLVEFDWKSKEVEEQFRQKIKGYVSVFRQTAEDIPIRYIGECVKPLLYTIIYEDVLSEFQTKSYLTAFEKDVRVQGAATVDNVDQYSSFYLNSLQASLMVFPDGSYGQDAKRYFEQRRNNQKFYDNYNHLFFEETGMRPTQSRDENLRLLQKYSQIYYSIIRDITDPENEKKCFYVYSDKINGSGILRIINLLTQVFHFSLFRGKQLSWNEANKANRCLYLNEKDGQVINVAKQLEVFNSYENRHGEYIRVVFGTDKTREGVTIKNIQKMHIITPNWNFGKKNQAEGRGIRLNSHAALENAEVDIYLHCAIPRHAPLTKSVNFLQYIRSEVKEKNNFLFSYAFLTSAVDCQINYYNNYRLANDYSASCYFQKCKYSCEGITKINVKHLNSSNLNYFYLLSNVHRIMPYLSNLFVRNIAKVITFDELKNVLKKENITDLILFETINIIIDEPILIKNPYNISLFLCREGDLFYVSSVRNLPEGELIGNDNIMPEFSISHTVNQIQINLFQKFFPQKLEFLSNLLSENKDEIARDFFDSFPSPMKQLLEANVPKPVRDRLLNKEPVEATPVKPAISLDDAKIKKYKFYGLIDKDKFKLRDVSDDAERKSNKTKTKGENCQTVQVDKIIFYIIQILTKHEEPTFEQNIETIVHLIPPKSLTLNENLRNILAMDREEIKQHVAETGKEWEKMYPDDYRFTHEELKYYALLKILNQRRKILCEFLFQRMKRYGLIF